MLITRTNNAGFTLIELMLYLVLAGIMLGVLTNVYNLLMTGRIKNETINEVEQQGQQALQQITQAVRNADSIISPAPGTASSALVLGTYAGATTPTTFTSSGAVLTVCEGNSCLPINLTEDNVLFSGLTFINLSRPNTPGGVRIQFNLESASVSGRNEYDYEKVFYAGASLRQP